MARRISDIEDGFALKHQRKTKKRKKKPNVEGECTIPPPPVKHILSSYTMSNPTSKRAVSDYVETQARDETVQHAERIMSEHVVGRDYDCWDIHTDKDRYWVITNPTNLYSQHYFPSLDFTLSFHIGVMLRAMALQRGAPTPAHKSRFTPIWRRWEQAAESYDDAEEAEDSQAVGMKCRETLIQFVRVLAKPEMVPNGEEAPKRADVVGWSSLIANAIALGDRNSLYPWTPEGNFKIGVGFGELADSCERRDTSRCRNRAGLHTDRDRHFRDCGHEARERQPGTVP